MAKPYRCEADSWIRRRQPEANEAEAVVRVICFHHGGGGASSFNGWYRLLPPEVDMVRVQLPGREDRLKEQLIGHIDAVVAGVVPQLAPLFDRPVAFYGHSLGAIIAFEAIRELRRNGHGLPKALFVSGRRAPHLPLSHPAFGLASDDGLVEYLRSMGGMPASLLEKTHWREQLLPIIREDLKISDLYVYRHEAALPCPITYFAGVADPWVKPRERQGWRAQTRSDFRLVEYGGGHFFSRDEQAAIVADIVQSLLSPAGSASLPTFGSLGGNEAPAARTRSI
jgi:medium-chain acyl-[acyl-carrier-protein] hydrolase